MSFDIFISHVIEDKDPFVRSLAKELIGLGYKVNYDALTLQPGDSLRGSLDQALKDCRFGVVIVSPSFLAIGWAQQELDNLNQRETCSGYDVVLPIFHQVKRAEVGRCSTALACQFGLESSATVSAVAVEMHRFLTDYRGHCRSCGKPLPKNSYFDEPGPASGYTCPDCGYMDVWGLLGF